MKAKRVHKTNSPILVLNSDYLPINITDFRKAFKLIYKGKAQVIVDVEEIVNTMDKSFKKPSVIRLLNYVNVPFRKVILSKENIFKRDGHKCAYCETKHNLTVDHIHPKSKGGKDTWENLISACLRCNARKGDLSLDESRMELKFQPFKPSPLHFMCDSNKHRIGWDTYLVF